MTDAEFQKATLMHFLQLARDALVWKVEGLDERAARWPLTPTGTNLLGLVKHASGIELGYFGEVFGRQDPALPIPAWAREDAPPNADMWATPDESIEDVVAFYRRVQAFADETIAALPLDARGTVSWWRRPDVTLHQILVHVVAELNRHAGHADILRELTDGSAGLRREWSNLPDQQVDAWSEHVARLRAVAESFAP
ncbi:DinB family protein [Cellulomonas alba]|uniref:DinB family protein n=1 Tax=Cellulomonas alba TaxID=3053467 RepID=A0ABT7SHU3_9CELL|nr:DinB family protein [Cellulomonas alba]MDM7855753.1 DinB family protein [Cellulomonas alba]